MNIELFERHALPSQRHKGFRAEHTKDWWEMSYEYQGLTDGNRLTYGNALQKSVQVMFSRLVDLETMGDMDKEHSYDVNKEQKKTIITIGDGLEEIGSSYFHIFSLMDLQEDNYLTHEMYVSDKEDFTPGRLIPSPNPNYNRHCKLGGIWVRVAPRTKPVHGAQIAQLSDLNETLNHFLQAASAPIPAGVLRPAQPAGIANPYY